MLAGFRRLAVLLVATATGLGALAALAGLAFGASLARSISVTFYVVGAFLLVLGFFAGSRGPLRPRAGDEEAVDPVTGMFGVGIATRGARRATEGERRDSVATAGIFLGLGIWLILLGVVIDGSVDVV
jgi:hypothetical protein